MSENTPAGWFLTLLKTEALGYQSDKLDKARLWQYWIKLRNFEMVDIRDGLNLATQASSKWFPSPALIVEQTTFSQRKRLGEEKANAIFNQMDFDDGPLSGVPEGSEEQAAYVESGGSLFEKIARVWECENRNNENWRGGTLPVRADLNQRRSKQFRVLCERRWPSKAA